MHLDFERTYFGRRITITEGGGFRCPVYNAKVGGAKDSQHQYGRAGDSWMEDITPEERYAYYQTRWPDRYGIGVYVARNFLHFDTRTDGPARWTGKGDQFTL